MVLEYKIYLRLIITVLRETLLFNINCQKETQGDIRYTYCSFTSTELQYLCLAHEGLISGQYQASSS